MVCIRATMTNKMIGKSAKSLLLGKPKNLATEWRHANPMIAYANPIQPDWSRAGPGLRCVATQRYDMAGRLESPPRRAVAATGSLTPRSGRRL